MNLIQLVFLLLASRVFGGVEISETSNLRRREIPNTVHSLTTENLLQNATTSDYVSRKATKSNIPQNIKILCCLLTITETAERVSALRPTPTASMLIFHTTGSCCRCWSE